MSGGAGFTSTSTNNKSGYITFNTGITNNVLGFSTAGNDPYSSGSGVVKYYLYLYEIINENERILYEPYRENFLNIDLSGHEPLRKVENVADYIDFGSNKIIRNIGKIDSYNNEYVGSNWISTTGELSTGATVYYELQSSQEEVIDNLPYITTFNNVTHVNIRDVNLLEPSIIEVEY